MTPTAKQKAEWLADQASEWGRKAGKKGGKALAATRTKAQRSAAAKKAALARWGKKR